MNKLPEPVSINELYLHGVNLRLEVLIDQVSSLLQHIANTQGVSVEDNKVEQQVVRPTRTRKA